MNSKPDQVIELDGDIETNTNSNNIQSSIKNPFNLG